MPRQIQLEERDAEFLARLLYDQAEGTAAGGERNTLERLVRIFDPRKEFEWGVEVMRSIAPRKTYRVTAPDEEIASQRALELAKNDDWTGASYGDPDYEVDGVQPIAPIVPEDAVPRWTPVGYEPEIPSWDSERIHLWLPKFAAVAKQAGYDEITHEHEGSALRINAVAGAGNRVLAGSALVDAFAIAESVIEHMHPIAMGWRFVFIVPADTKTHRGKLAINLHLTVK